MDDLFPHLQALIKSERRVAMATLVATKGTTPKKEGAKMWVGEGGRVLGSVTIGGCVDARVIAESEGVLGGSAPKLLKMALGDEDAWELGLSCGGTVEVLVEPLELGAAPGAVVALYQRIDAELQAGRGACLVRLLADPSRALLVREGGAAEGTLGDERLDRLARARAVVLLAKNSSRSEPLAEGDAEGPEAFFEVHAPRPHLVAIGAGHVAMPLVELARQLGFRTTVIDPRPRFASRERFPGADELLVGIASELAAAQRCVRSTAVVITIHDYKVEVPALEAILKGEPGYVGVLGNKRRGAAVFAELRERGVPAEKLALVHWPIGLDLGAQSASEIALSILAEIVAVRGGKDAAAVAAKPQAAGSAP